MRTIELSEPRRLELQERLQRFFRAEFDESLSDFRAAELLDMIVRSVGPAVYNQAVQDVRAHLQVKLDDLDGEIYVDEDR